LHTVYFAVAVAVFFFLRVPVVGYTVLTRVWFVRTHILQFGLPFAVVRFVAAFARRTFDWRLRTRVALVYHVSGYWR